MDVELVILFSISGETRFKIQSKVSEDIKNNLRLLLGSFPN